MLTSSVMVACLGLCVGVAKSDIEANEEYFSMDSQIVKY